MNNSISQFLDHLLKVKRYSLHTVQSYENDLMEFSLFLKDTFNIHKAQDITTVMVRNFMVYMVEKKHSAKTINRKLSSIRSWVKYLLQRNLLATDFMEKIQSPRVGKRLPTFIKDENFLATLDDLILEHSFNNIRDLTMVKLLFFTGIRRAELQNLRLIDLDFDNQKIKVLGKGNKERFIPLSPNMMDVIKNYLSSRSEINSSEPYLFISKRGKKLYPKAIYNGVNKILSLATSTEKKSPHILRHTYATQLLNNGADINAIKELLGHASLTATQVYTHNSIEKLKNIYAKAHPRN